MERGILREYELMVSHNRRWADFVHRPGDIFVCTPAKCGTTWMQTIVVSLLFPNGDAPGSVGELSPWLDAHFEPVEVVLARLEAQTHRRCIKTHTPADGIPLWDDAFYIAVLRDPRDAFMSWLNHVDHMKPEVIGPVMGIPADQMPASLRNPDVHRYFAEWLDDASMLHNASTWWDVREAGNVLLVHYNDLKADLEAEMRRVAGFLGIDVPDALWPAAVKRCTFEGMKARPQEINDFDRLFKGGAETFLFKGTNGRWRDVLTEEDLDRYAERVAELLPPDARAWLEAGSLALGARP